MEKVPRLAADKSEGFGFVSSHGQVRICRVGGQAAGGAGAGAGGYRRRYGAGAGGYRRRYGAGAGGYRRRYGAGAGGAFTKRMMAAISSLL